jgi:hypothetical protein
LLPDIDIRKQLEILLVSVGIVELVEASLNKIKELPFIFEKLPLSLPNVKTPGKNNGTSNQQYQA